MWSVPSGEEVVSLPHPYYVYATCFIPPSLPTSPPTPPSPHHYTLLTGAYDKIVRSWSLTPTRVQVYTMYMYTHDMCMNCICISYDMCRMAYMYIVYGTVCDYCTRAITESIRERAILKNYMYMYITCTFHTHSHNTLLFSHSHNTLLFSHSHNTCTLQPQAYYPLTFTPVRLLHSNYCSLAQPGYKL